MKKLTKKQRLGLKNAGCYFMGLTGALGMIFVAFEIGDYEFNLVAFLWFTIFTLIGHYQFLYKGGLE